MAKRIKIEFVSNPTPTVNLVFTILYPPNSQTIGATIGSSVAIGVDKEATATNLYNYYLTIPLIFDFVDFTLVGDIIYVDFEPDNDANLSFPTLISSQSSILISEVVAPAVEPLRTVLARSTYSVRTTPSVLFDTAEMQLFIWNGNINDAPSTPTYNLSKPVVQLGQGVINFDINELLKEYTKPSIDNYQLSGVQPSQYDGSCWAEYSVICYDDDTNVYEISGSFFGVYGFGFFNEGFNPLPNSKVFISGDRHNYYENEDSRLYFITDGLTSLEVNGTPVTVTADTDLNYEYLQSINLNDYAPASGLIVVDFVYEDETRSITFDVLCEGKYEVYNCVFINKFGVPQSFFLTKVAKKSDEAETETYRGLNSVFGVYDTTKHQYKDFNRNGRGKVTLNTDNLNENQNNVIQELIYSESVWLIENGIIKPVTLDKKSIDYKTSLNDKQIQYTMDFKYAFDTINQVQ